jgi:hypothetical protein
MNGAVVGNGGGQWLVRGAKIAVFDLPKDAEIEIDLSDGERTSKRPVITPDSTLERVASTSEVDTNDILTAVPIDPTVPFEMRVPETVHARAALLTAQLPQKPAEPRTSARALLDSEPEAEPTTKRSRWTMVAIFAVCAVVGTGAGLVANRTAPIAPSSAHAFKAAASPKVVAQRTSELAGAMIPTVHVDSLPRVHR